MPRLTFNARTPLYTSDARAWRMDQFPEVMGWLQAIGKPVVIFVHGRGKEPGKGLLGGRFTQGLAVHKIERGHDARKPALLVHSMGSIVLQHAIQDGHWPAANKLFSAVLLSQPDADDQGHATWLEWLATRELTFVTWNRDDHVLQRSTDAREHGAHALGLGTDEPLAPSARHIDISRMGPLGQKDEDHEVFGKGAMNGQLHLCRFFTQALTGAPVVLDPGVNVESVSRGVVHRLRDQREPGNPCLNVPDLSDILEATKRTKSNNDEP